MAKKSKKGSLSDLSKKLAAMKKGWKKAKKEAASGAFPDQAGRGTFIVKRHRMQLLALDKGLTVVTEFKVLRGEEKGKVCSVWNNLEREDGMVWFARHLSALGYDLDDFDIENLEEIVDDMNSEGGDMYRVRNTESDGYINTKIIKKLDEDVDDDDDEEEDDEELEEDDSVEESDEEEEEDEDSEEDDAEESDDESDASESPEKGVRVSAEIEGEVYEGVVTKVNAKKETADVKFDDGDKDTFDFSDLTILDEEDSEEEEEDEDEVEMPSKGDAVVFTNEKGNEVEGKVLKVNAKKEEVTVKPKKGKQVVLSAADVSILA